MNLLTTQSTCSHRYTENAKKTSGLPYVENSN